MVSSLFAGILYITGVVLAYHMGQDSKEVSENPTSVDGVLAQARAEGKVIQMKGEDE